MIDTWNHMFSANSNMREIEDGKGKGKKMSDRKMMLSGIVVNWHTCEDGHSKTLVKCSYHQL